LSYFHLNNNLLSGEIPASLANLILISEVHIETNCLFALDQTLRIWLDNHDPGWEATQNNCGTITVTSPNGGENWSVESSHDITWTTSGNVGNVKIEYTTDNGSSWSNIISSTANTGSYNWTVANTLSSQCLIKISDANIVSLSDTSDGTFSISELTTITVTSPNGGENWLLGSNHEITWTSSGTVGNVKIEYSPDNGANWTEITADTENDGSYTWTLPNTCSSNYLVRVSETDGDPSDASDGVFTLSEGISGTVTDSSGNGIANVAVTVWHLNRYGIAGGTTGANGYYEIPGITPGNYLVSFDAQNAGNYVQQWFNNRTRMETADIVTINPGAAAANINAQLADGGTVSGRVTDEAGNGIVNVDVHIKDISGYTYAQANTDVDGYYTVQGAAPGNCRVYFNGPSAGNYIPEYYNNKNGWQPLSSDTVAVTAGQTTENIDAQLAAGGTITGRVTDGSGNGIPGVNIGVRELTGNGISGANTDADGYYTATAIPTGNYMVYFDGTGAGNYVPEFYNNKNSWEPQTADTVSVTAGQTTPGIDVQLDEGATITGRVTDGSWNGIDSVSVQIRNTDNYTVIWTGTDGSGNYTARGIPPGSWKVLFQASQYTNYVNEFYNDKMSLENADLLNVTVGQTIPNIDAQLADGGSISGRVADISGNGIPGVSIGVFDIANNMWLDRAGGLFTDENGYYTYTGIPAGNHKVSFDTYNVLFYRIEYYNDKQDFQSADAVSVTAGQDTPNINAQLAPAGTISGRVTDENGNGIPNIWVTVYDLNNNHMGGQFTDTQGNYIIPYGLIAGSYKVYFDAHNRGLNYINEWYNNKDSFANADAVIVVTGQITTGIDAQLAAGGTISGRVTDESGNGIADAGVNIQDTNGSNIDGTRTDADGNYSFQGLPAGNWKVYFNAANVGNYLPRYYNDKDGWNPQLADSVSVTAGQTAAGINAQLTPGGIISGRVVDQAGNGIPNASVEVMDIAQYYTINRSNTDANGYYTARGLPAGTWKIRFDATNVGNYVPEFYNDKFKYQDADTVAVALGQTVSNIDAQLADGGIITGRVTDGSGNGLPSVSIEIRDAANYTFIWAGTDDGGYYTAQGVPAGNWRVFFRAPQSTNFVSEYYNDKLWQESTDPVNVIAGQTTANIDAQLAAGGSISGRVIDMAGNGVANIYIRVCDASNNNWLPGSAATDSGGYYTFNGIPTGNYKVRFDTYNELYLIQEYYNDKYFQEIADPVSVTAGQTTADINAQLAAGGAISGRVTDENGNGVANVWVTIFNSNNGSSNVNGAFTDMTGNYVVHFGLSAGAYKVYFDASNRGLNYINEWYNNKESFANADAVIVVTGQLTTGIDAQLAGGGAISGRVIDESGNGIANARVNIQDANGSNITWTGTDADGNYSAYGLPAGNWKVYFNAANVGNYIAQYYNNKNGWQPQSADSVSVTPGQTVTGINAQLLTGGIISGRVVDQAGNGIPNASVEVMETANYRTIQWLNTDVNGYYIARGVPAGTWKIHFYASNVGNYVPEFYNNKFAHRDGDTVTVAIGQTIENIDAQLAEGGIITGRVTDGSGNGIPNVSIQIRDTTNYTFIWTGTDGSGYYTAQGVPAGSWLVFFQCPQTSTFVSEFYNDKLWQSSADLVNVTAGQTISNIDAQLAVGGAISGHVADESGNGIYNVNAQVRDANNNVLTGANTDGSGNYTIYGLTPGAYKIYFETNNAGNYVREYYNDKTSLAAADSVTVTAGQTTENIDAQLAAGATITGRVTDQGGNGIQSVRVRVYDANNLQVMNTPTNSSGDYTLMRILPGNYRVRFDTSAMNANYIGEYYNDKVTLAAADVQALVAGQTLTANAVLSPGGIITGRITDTVGSGVANVRLIVRGAYSNTNYSANRYTDGSGNYTVQGLPAGSYKVWFNTDETQNSYITEWYNDKADFLTAGILNVIPGQTLSGIDAVLASGGTISGHISDAATGDPIPDIEVYALDLNKGITGCYAYTDENGDYAVKGLPTGTFKINYNSYSYNLYYGGNYNDQWHNNKKTFQSADAVAITVGQTIPGINAALTADGGIIRGRVTNENGDGIPNVDIWVTTDWSEYSGWEAFTDANGYYQVTGIPTGSYHVLFLTNTSQGNHLDEVYNDKIMTGNTTIEADWVNVTEGQAVENIDAVLTLGGYVSGRVTDQNGNPIRDIRVRVYDAANGDYYSRHNALTDFYGNYTIMRVRPGQLKAYFQSFESAGGNYKAEYYNDKTTLAAADAFTVTATQTTTGIDAVLATGGGILCGYVRDKNGAALKNAAVQLFDKNAARCLLGQVSCNVNGYFEFKGVNPDQYKLYISCNNYITPEWYNNKASHAQADLVAVSEGKTTLVEITLGENSSLKVVSPNGGEVWNTGSSHPITWSNNGPVEDVRIEYSIDNGVAWIEIVSAVENIGIYNWAVPIIDSTSVNCLVRISEAGDGSPSDVGDAVFTIFANPASWIPVEGLQNNMVVYGKAYNGPNEALAGDWIGAFGPGGVNDCRGTSIIGANGNFYFTIGSNAVSGETITFKLWPYPTGPALDADEAIEFVGDSIYGGLPLHFGARTQAISLVGGWNWVGFNTIPPDTSLNTIFGALAGKIAQVKTQTQAAVYTGGTWIGDLADMNGIADGAMYKINATQSCILSLNGATVSYNKPIPMITGWKWVSYLPVLPQAVDAALNTIMPLLIQAKSQTQSTVKVGGGLIGDLTRMEPGKGYTIQVSGPGVLVYPHGESAYPDQSADATTQSMVSGTTSIPWKTIQGNQYNMVSYGKVFFEGAAINTPGYYLVGVGPKGEGDCRSISSIGTDGNYFSTVLGNTNGEALKFKLYNSTTHKTYDVVESQAFQSDALKADYNFRARSIRVTAPTGDQQHNMGSICSIAWEAYEVTNVKIELYKNGKSVSAIVNSVPAKTHSYSWTIPARLRSGNNYQIKISCSDVGVMAEDATANFTILPTAALSLNYPVGTEIWQVKRSYDITWGSSGIDNIKIELYKGAALNTVISESTPAAAGKYTWTVPANQVLGSDYKIKISSVDAGINLSDAGKSAFTIAAYKNTSADFDGDGRADIAWRYYGTGGYNCIWLSGITQDSNAVNDARLAPQAATIQDETNLDNQLKGTGDFNNDGKEDLLWRNKTDGANFVWYMNGTTFAGTAQLPVEITLSWDICGTGDFNSDGKTDILWRNRAAGGNKVWLMNGTTRTGEVTLTTEANLNWDITGAGDFDGDGKPDILWRNTVDGSVRIWLMNGTTLVRTEQLSAVNADWEIAGVGDYDGNGKPDIFWRHKVDGRDSVWIMDGLSRQKAETLTQVANKDWRIEN